MATATLITSAEFQARPDEFDQSGNRIKEELIGGEIVKMASASWRHDLVKNNVGTALILHLATHSGLGLRAVIEYAFQVSESDTLTPDVAVLRTERFFSVEGRLIKGAPEIAIEVISPTDTASGIKRKIKAYLENGAGSVWIFYDDGSVMLHNGSQVRVAEGEQLLEDPLLPGFSVPVSTFFKA